MTNEVCEQSKVAEDGGPAFPELKGETVGEISLYESRPGMALRDYFAAKALQGLISSGAKVGSLEIKEPLASNLAMASYTLADAMLVARKES